MKSILHGGLVFWFGLLFVGKSLADNAVDFDFLLNHADSIKSSDKNKFIGILSEIKPQLDLLSTSQKNYYFYLNGYVFHCIIPLMLRYFSELNNTGISQ